MTLDVVLVIVLCLLFTLAAMGGVTTAAFVWSAYQRREIEAEMQKVREDARRMYDQLRVDYDGLARDNATLRNDHEKLQMHYMALSELLSSKAPEVHISAGGNVDVGELTGRDNNK